MTQLLSAPPSRTRIHRDGVIRGHVKGCCQREVERLDTQTLALELQLALIKRQRQNLINWLKRHKPPAWKDLDPAAGMDPGAGTSHDQGRSG